MALMQVEAAALMIALFTLCMGSLSVGLLLFIGDVNISLSALKLETGAENWEGD